MGAPAARVPVMAQLGLLGLLLGAPGIGAAGQEAPLPLSARPARQDSSIVCEIRLGRLLTPPVESTLKSGLPVVIDLACELIPEKDGHELARLLRSELRYDVWEDRYSLVRGGESEDFADYDAVMAACRHVDALPLGPESALGDVKRFSLRVRVAVNPLSGEERERMARWLAETVTDAGDPSSRELRLNLGALIQRFFRGGDSDIQRGGERSFGPFLVSELPLLTPVAAADSASARSPAPGEIPAGNTDQAPAPDAEGPDRQPDKSEAPGGKP